MPRFLKVLNSGNFTFCTNHPPCKPKMSFGNALKAFMNNKSNESNSKPAEKSQDSLPPKLSAVWEETESFSKKYNHPEDTSERRTGRRVHKVGLLFMIRDSFPNELLWRLWLSEVGNDVQVRVWIHAKDRKSIASSWVRNCLTGCHLSPNWGSLELTKTMVAMLHEAHHKHPDIDHFIFASESCIPWITPQEFISQLEECDRSWMMFKTAPNNGYARIQQFDILHGRIPDNLRAKADQWVCLSRQHTVRLMQWFDYLALSPSRQAETVNTNHDGYLRDLSPREVRRSRAFSLFEGMRASDEMFFPTVLSMLGCISEVHRARATFAEWEGQDASPVTWQPAAVFGVLQSLRDLPDSLEYSLPQLKQQSPGLRSAMTENTLFFRKIQFSGLPSVPSVSSPAFADSLVIIQKWWLFIHRNHLSDLARRLGGSDSRSGAQVLRDYWETHCAALIRGACWENRTYDEVVSLDAQDAEERQEGDGQSRKRCREECEGDDGLEK